MNSPLVRCSNCKRHIYASESSCPFCARQSSVSPTVLAVALGAGLAIAGCSSEAAQSKPPEILPQPDKTAPEEPKPEPPNIAPAPMYGAPPQPIEPPAAAYGAPPAPNPNPRTPPR